MQNTILKKKLYYIIIIINLNMRMTHLSKYLMDHISVKIHN